MQSPLSKLTSFVQLGSLFFPPVNLTSFCKLTNFFSSDKIIRHRACTLRDTAYAYIKAEMDTDFEEKCRGIRDNRQNRYKFIAKPSAPDFVHVAPNRVIILLNFSLVFHGFFGIDPRRSDTPDEITSNILRNCFCPCTLPGKVLLHLHSAWSDFLKTVLQCLLPA